MTLFCGKALTEAKLFAKYGIVGFMGTIIDFLCLFILVEYSKINVLWATTIAFMLAATHNYYFNKIWTFKHPSKTHAKLYTKFIIVSIGGLAINNTSMYIFIEIFGIYYLLAKLFTAGIVPIWNYLGNKYWTFNQNNR
jgi:putative flippase GtrA